MGIGTDRNLHPLLFGIFQEAPVEIQPPGIGVDLDANPQFRRSVDHRVVVDGISFPGQQKPPGGMAEHRHIGILHRPDQPAGGLIPGHAKLTVDAGDDQIEGRQHFIRKIERAVTEDIAFDALENAKIVHPGIDRVDLGLLLLHPFGIQAVGIGCHFGMIGDHQVFIAQFLCRPGHLLYRMHPVAPEGVGVDHPAQIVHFQQLRKRLLRGGLYLAVIFPQLRGDKIQAEFPENGFLIGAGYIGFIAEQAILIKL